MNDVNDKLIEGLEEQRKRIADLEDDLATQVGHTEMIRNNHCKVSIVNDSTDMTASDIPPKQIKVGDYHYAFVEDNEKSFDVSYEGNNICLWLQTEDVVWIEVSDLTELKVWEYQEIKSYAVAVGMIKEEEDLFI